MMTHFRSFTFSKYMGLALMVSLSFLTAKAQNPVGPPPNKAKIAAEEQSREVFAKVVDFSKRRHYEAFAKYLAYDGSNISRKLSSPINYNDSFEKLTAENSSNKLKSVLEKYELYNLANFNYATGINHEMALWDLELTKKNGKTNTQKVSFVKIGNQFYFIGIN